MTLYYRRDSYYKTFLLPQVRWDASRQHYAQTADTDAEGVVVRTAEDKSEDLKDFLNTIVGYLPFPYLTEKILNGTTKLAEVWDCIHLVFLGAKPSLEITYFTHTHTDPPKSFLTYILIYIPYLYS